VIPPRFARLFALLCLGASFAFAADDEPKPRDPNYGLPTPSSLTPEQQAAILRAFQAAYPPLRTFALTFQGTRFSIVRPDPDAPRVIIAANVEFAQYSVSIVYSGTFDRDFTRLLTSRCDLFGAYDTNRELKPGQKRTPLRLRLEDMETFCRDPVAFLEREFAATR
jgi:hypothetical protein